jgi:hypothetical protein
MNMENCRGSAVSKKKRFFSSTPSFRKTTKQLIQTAISKLENTLNGKYK